MAASSSSSLVLCFLLIYHLSVPSLASEDPVYQSFRHCLSQQVPHSTNVSDIIYTPNTPSLFSSLLYSSIRNLLFVTPTTHYPLLIILPSDVSHVRASVRCCRAHRLGIRVRSGGHDYEGLSYRSESDRAFAVVDLAGLRSVDVLPDLGLASVQAGATVGELYYHIADKSGAHGFPAGICPTVGVGGLIAGGGFGTMLRRYGLAADNVVDAEMVDVEGRVLDRESMGEDLFWAIRGGGASSFGVVVSWKLSLAPVPPIVTVFTVHKTLDQGAIRLVDRWQRVAHRLNENLFIRIVIQPRDDTSGGREIEALFNSLFLGGCSELLEEMNGGFPELGLQQRDCREMSWAESVMYFADFKNGEPMEVLLDRGSKPERFFKARSDFVTEPIPGSVFRKIWGKMMEYKAGVLIMDPYGGMMSSIADYQIPFPHRGGVLYNIQYFTEWRNVDEIESEKRIGWINMMYRDMGPYVSKRPRAAYLNYRDLDLGRNEEEGNTTSYSKAKIWGVKYFKNNFARLACVKAVVDPDDFFRSEQSIPPLFTEKCRIGLKGGIGFKGFDSRHKSSGAI